MRANTMVIKLQYIWRIYLFIYLELGIDYVHANEEIRWKVNRELYW
jgi:hypothetical protein